MTETIYENKKTEPARRVQLPNNRRQIGQPQQAEPEVFIEDYAFTYAKGLSERDYTGCVVGVLVGEHVENAESDKILVRGVLEARDVLIRDVICFTEENWTGIYRDMREFFPGQQIVGWYLGGPGFLLEDEERQKKILTDNFGGGDKVLLKVDSIEKEQSIWYYDEGNLQRLPGYYIYYEKNTEMQSYMAETKQQMPLEERNQWMSGAEGGKGQEESAGGWSEKGTGYTVERNLDRRGVQQTGARRGTFYQLFYATSGVLTCLAILVIAGLAMQIQERDQLKELLNEREELVSSMQQVYVVEEGETVETICQKLYGSTERAEAICILNGLDAGEELKAGQKLFVP